MKKYFIIIMTVLMSMLVQPALATQLPTEIKNYIIQNVPDATIRFDGLVTLPDGTIYLPLIPAYTVKDEEFAVKYVHPAKKAFNKKPDVVIFTNNYCLLKLIKTKSGVTVASLKDYPIEVRTGILPQDLLVPKGLVLPDVLIGVLGDLNIPLNSNLQVDTIKKAAKEAAMRKEEESRPQKVNVIPQLKNKQYFITNFNSNFIYITPSDMSNVQFTLKLDGIPQVVKEIGSKFLLVVTSGKTYIDVVDIQNEEIAKQVDLGVEADEIVVTKDENFAYVISNKNPNLYVIDIPTMSLIKQIQVKGLPEKLSLSADETKLVYQDSTTSDIYSVELNNNYVNIYQCNIPNISKLALVDDKIYAISRTKNVLKILPYQVYVVDAKAEEQEVLGSKKSHLIKSAIFATGSATKNFFKRQQEEYDKLTYVDPGETINVSLKPIDMVYYNGKFYILSAVTNSVDIFNPQTNSVEKTVPLNIAGFSNKFNKIQDENIVLITNVLEKKYIVFDLEKQIVLQVNPIDLPMTTLTVVNKTKVQKNVEKEVQGKEMEKIVPDNLKQKQENI